MTTILKIVRSKIDERSLEKRGLLKDGCRVSMANAPKPRLVVDFDRPGSPIPPTETRCDYLMIAEVDDKTHVVAVLELKRGKLHADEVRRQLQAGASAAEKLVPNDKAIMFRPIAACGKIPKIERRKLKQRRQFVRFHGLRTPVVLTSCGAPLATALK